MKNDETYSVLLNLYVNLVNSQARKTIDPNNEWHNNAQGLSIKLFRHLVSMRAVADVATVKYNGAPIATFLDNASVVVITRAAWETYLVFYYIYGGSDSALSEFRHKTWCLGGLTDRQQFHASKRESLETLAREKIDIEQLKSEIAKAPEVVDYTSKQQRKLLEGEWKIGKGWNDLAINAGFHKQYFENVYSYLCGGSHSNYISVLQVNQASMQDQQMLAEAPLGIGLLLMAHFAFTYSAFFPSARAVLDSDVQGKRAAETWRFGSKEMTAIYGG